MGEVLGLPDTRLGVTLPRSGVRCLLPLLPLTGPLLKEASRDREF